MKGAKTVKKPADSLDIVRQGVQFYAGRAVLFNLQEVKAPSGKAAFRFDWFYDHPMELIVDPKAKTLEFRNLFPNLTKKSEVYRQLERYIESLHSPKRPENERIHRRKAECRCAIRSGAMSLVWTVKGKQYEYAVHRIIDVAHDVFQEVRDKQPAYIQENYNVPEE